ncbi:PotA ABC-type spermidine/putrescine transport systems, ATPase components [Burkholderiaceae bacterium]
MNTILKIDEISLSFASNDADVSVLKRYSLTLQAGETVCILGPSGCGKSSLLRVIAGFETIDAGAIYLNDTLLSSATHTVAPEHRRVGFMFQDYALFPHLNVAQNIGFGLKKLSSQAREQQVQALLKLVDLEPYAKRFPHELSGGQQQRAALARALAPKPDILLLDEPFSNLDADTRERLIVELRTILKQTGVTTLMVTHSHSEAVALGDRIERMG